MTDERKDQILSLIERLTKVETVARQLALAQTVYILAIAQLDLKTIAHGISDEELRAFTALVSDD
jgi:hypothetical protein